MSVMRKLWTDPRFLDAIQKKQAEWAVPVPPAAQPQTPVLQTGARGAGPAGMRSPNSTAAEARVPAPGGAPGGPKTAAAPAKARKGKAIVGKAIVTGSYYAIVTLVENLVSLADLYRLRRQNVPTQLKTTVDSSLDSMQNQALVVVTHWWEPATLPQAHAVWQGLKPQLRGVLTDAVEVVEPTQLKPGWEAIASISKNLSEFEARAKLNEAVKAFQTPDVSEALDLQKAKEFEPSLELIRTANKQIGRALKGSQLGNVSKVIEIYFKFDKMADKLQAFKDAGLLGKMKTAADFQHFLGSVTHEAVNVYTEAALALAEKAGDKALIVALKERLGVLKKIKGVLAIYSAIKSAYELVKAIQSGDPHAIADATRNFAIASIEVAQGFGAVTAGGAAALVGGALVVWATAEAIMMAAEVAHWFRDQRALEAFKFMLAEAKKVVPHGKQMAAAHHLMIEALNSQDEGAAAESDLYEKHANKYAINVAKGIKALASHIQANDLDSVGGYPKLVEALGPARDQLSHVAAGIIPAEPIFLSDAFEIILQGLKSMATAGNKLYGDAG
jgi:hypothetical protein